MAENSINGIELRNAETKLEKLLLGVLFQEASRIEFGKVTIEFGIRASKINRLTITESSRTVNIGIGDFGAGSSK